MLKDQDQMRFLKKMQASQDSQDKTNNQRRNNAMDKSLSPSKRAGDKMRRGELG